MVRYIPTGRELILLASISNHIAVPLISLQTGDVETDIAASIDLISLAKHGLIVYSMGDEVVRCTAAGRLWVQGHENWRAGQDRRMGSGH
ncbi:MAG TPA: hypothetical protein VLC46_20420 [Thermoanaerobaculia bacterium]|nr:hypothetical protein [Thermoanaerobaculia bacterium]